ncbi:hypothetical protein [Hymenobacter sp.]|uniref:hypothetical protein n=1 Tax=Hymenobacter sp. TaxID=1898978 RepID=UPI00286D1D12|nr:hypothetical protein [Hymenobacter sp.]
MKIFQTAPAAPQLPAPQHPAPPTASLFAPAKLLAVGLVLAALPLGARAQGLPTRRGADPAPRQVAVLFGLNQPLLAKGFNIEANYYTKRLVFDYSHGASLDFSGPNGGDQIKAQGLALHMPFTTGFGVGYRFSKLVNLRVEPKLHRFEIYYAGDAQTAGNRITAYNTFSLGLGLYFKWQPFEKQEGLLRGLIVAPSVRYWPNLATGLTNDQFRYQNRTTDRTETHQAQQPGIANTPVVVNVSVGYALDLRKRK